jgi:hypothetical protein
LLHIECMCFCGLVLSRSGLIGFAKLSPDS